MILLFSLPAGSAPGAQPRRLPRAPLAQTRFAPVAWGCVVLATLALGACGSDSSEPTPGGGSTAVGGGGSGGGGGGGDGGGGAGGAAAPCGDQIRSGAELCDGADLGLETCQLLGYSGGTLGCTNECIFDPSGCNAAMQWCDIGAPPTGVGAPADPIGNDVTDGYTAISACGPVAGNAVLTADLTTNAGDCLTVEADNVVIDGAGFTITASGHAVSVTNRVGLTVRNLRSSSDVQVFGLAGNAHVHHCALGGVGVYSADDVIVEDTRLGWIHVEGVNADPVLRFILRRSTVSSAEPKLAFFLAGGTTPAECAAGQFTIENNLFSSAQNGQADEPLAFTLRCSTGNTVRNNRIEAMGQAAGIYLRDDANDSLFENNTVRVANAWAAALFWGSGTDLNGEPSNNTFRRNAFVAAPARALWIQAHGNDNTFERNLFLSSSPEGNRIEGGGGNTWDHNTFFNNADGVGVVFASLAMPFNTWSNDIVASQLDMPYGFDGTTDLAAYVGDYNLFFSGAGTAIFGSYGELDTWRLASHQQDGHSQEADPLFVDRASWDMRLGAGSPAIGADDTHAGDIGALPFNCGN